MVRVCDSHVIVVSRAKPRKKGNGDDRWTDVTEVHWWLATDTVVCYQRNSERNAPRHGQLVKCVMQCWRDVVISPERPFSVLTLRVVWHKKYTTWKIPALAIHKVQCWRPGQSWNVSGKISCKKTESGSCSTDWIFTTCWTPYDIHCVYQG